MQFYFVSRRGQRYISTSEYYSADDIYTYKNELQTTESQSWVTRKDRMPTCDVQYEKTHMVNI